MGLSYKMSIQALKKDNPSLVRGRGKDHEQKPEDFESTGFCLGCV